LPHHDHVGVGTHHRSQPGGEGEPGPGVDLDLGHPLEVVLDGVLDGDDVLLGRVDHAQGGVQGRRLTGPGRTGDEQGPVGLVEGVREAPVLGVGHPQLVELHDHRLLVQDSDDHRLTVDAGQGHDTEVDLVAVDGHAHATVLGNPALGDVELGHDLDAGDGARGHAPRHGRDVVQDAVDAEAHPQVASVGGEVEVR